MSHPIAQLVARSDLPYFLRKGVAGKLAALADDDGEFADWLSVNYLVRKCRYHHNTRSLTKRTIQHQLHALQRCGFLEIVGGAKGRGDFRTWVLHPEALATVQAADPILRPAHRRTGVLCQAFVKGVTTPPKGVTEPGIAAASPKPAESSTPPRPAHAPPNLAGAIGRQPRRRWDAVRTPDENFKVFVAAAHKLFDYLVAAGEDLREGEIVELFKTRIANDLPGQLLNTSQVLSALDNAAYRRRMLGIPVPANAGSNGQTAFARHRQQHTQSSYARVDAR